MHLVDLLDGVQFLNSSYYLITSTSYNDTSLLLLCYFDNSEFLNIR